MKLGKFLLILDKFEQSKDNERSTELKRNNYNEKNRWITSIYNQRFKELINKTDIRKRLKQINKYQIDFDCKDEYELNIYICNNTFDDVCKFMINLEMIIFMIIYNSSDLKTFAIKKIEMFKTIISKENSTYEQEICKNLESASNCLDNIVFPRANYDSIKAYCENICEEIDESCYSYLVLNDKNSIIDKSKNILNYAMLWEQERR